MGEVTILSNAVHKHLFVPVELEILSDATFVIRHQNTPPPRP